MNTIVGTFLINPSDKKAFYDLYSYSLGIAIAYIRKLIASGWKFPQTESDYDKNLENIANSNLNDFLESSFGRPYFRIFDYYKRHEIEISSESDPAQLEFHYKLLLTGFIKRNYKNITREEDPQLANFKRRIKEILKSDEYRIKEYENEKIVYLLTSENNLRYKSLDLSSSMLLALIIEHFEKATTYVSLCRSVFESLDVENSFRNFVFYLLCTRTFIMFYHHYVSPEQYFSIAMPSPESFRIRTLSNMAVEYSLSQTIENNISGFVKKGKIQQHEMPLIEKALDRFLNDFGFDGRSDSLPQYIYEQLPNLKSDEYQKKYKHFFDTITGKAKEYFIDYMKNNL